MSTSSDDYSLAESALNALQELVDNIGEDHPFDEIEDVLLDEDDDDDDTETTESTS